MSFYFSYNYKQKDITINPESYTKQQLYTEMKRLAGLTQRRIKQIEKKGYSSLDVEQLKIRNEIIKSNLSFKGGDFSISKSWSKQVLIDLVRSYDQFLTKKGSTYKGIESMIEEEKNRMKDYSKNGKKKNPIFDTGRSNAEISKILAILDNADISNSVEFFGSDNVIDLVTESDFSTSDIIDRMLEFQNSSKEEDTDDIIKNIFGIEFDEKGEMINI